MSRECPICGDRALDPLWIEVLKTDLEGEVSFCREHYEAIGRALEEGQ